MFKLSRVIHFKEIAKKYVVLTRYLIVFEKEKLYL